MTDSLLPSMSLESRRCEHDLIIVPCSACNTEGRIYRTRYGGNDPDWIDCGPCPYCDGTGDEMIEGEPLEEADIFAKAMA